MDHSHPLYPSFAGKGILCKVLGLMNFRMQSSRNVFGTASRSIAHLCSRWQMHHAIVSNITASDNTHMCDEVLMKLAGDPNWHRHVLQFQLKKWPQGREIQVSYFFLSIIIWILSPDKSLLTFKTLQHPRFLRWFKSRSFNFKRPLQEPLLMTPRPGFDKVNW